VNMHKQYNIHIPNNIWSSQRWLSIPAFKSLSHWQAF
jgi:hypothetical protein